jgi:hypothetical protein
MICHQKMLLWKMIQIMWFKFIFFQHFFSKLFVLQHSGEPDASFSSHLCKLHKQGMIWRSNISFFLSFDILPEW